MVIRWGGGCSPAISLSDASWSPSRCARRGMTAGGKLVAQPVGRHFQELPRGCLLQLRLKNRIEPLELDPRILGGKAPVHLDLLSIPLSFPGCYLLPDHLLATDGFNGSEICTQDVGLIDIDNPLGSPGDDQGSLRFRVGSCTDYRHSNNSRFRRRAASYFLLIECFSQIPETTLPP